MSKANKHFYSGFVNIDDVIVELDALNLTGGEKVELANLAHLNLHTTIVDAILSELSETDKKVFLELLANDDHKRIWEHLNNKVEKIEEKITQAGESVKKELRADIAKTRQT